VEDIRNFEDFCAVLKKSGFSMGGGNDKGIYAVVDFPWNAAPADSVIKWHTGDAETDPWEWRMRVLEERKDIAYAKLFFGTSGYITDEWYSKFVAARRNGEVFEEAYYNGKVSAATAEIYKIISENGATALHEIKYLGGFGKEDNSRFERSITELQMKMYITMCGRKQKKNKFGEGYGWSSTVFETAELFWEQRGVVISDEDPAAAFEEIRERILQLNPGAQEKQINKFIKG